MQGRLISGFFLFQILLNNLPAQSHEAIYQLRAIRSTDLQTRTKEVLDLAANGETFIVSRPQNRNAVILSEDKYNDILAALREEQYRNLVNSELDKSLARENEPNTKWFTGEQVKEMLGL